MKSKTIKDWLNELEEPYRTQALDNALGDTNHLVNSIHRALDYAFNWENSPQGLKYWQQLYNTL